MASSRTIFIISGAFLLAVIAFMVGLNAAVTKNSLFQLVVQIRSDIALVLGEMEAKDAEFLQPARGQGEGVTKNETSDNGLVLLTGFFDGGTELRLIERDGTIVARWPVRYTRLFEDTSFLDEPPQSDLSVDIHGALIEPDGSVVFNFEYAGAVKLDRCGKVVWTLRHPTHHSLEKAADGGYWIPGRVTRHDVGPDYFPPFTAISAGDYVKEDLVLKVSPGGEIVDEFSVPRMLYDNGLEALLTANGETFNASSGSWDRELVHLNKVGELSGAMADAFGQFEPGDLILSLRTYNLLLVVDPATRKVKWHQVGPWLRQHDPEFNRDGTITLFNNNAFQSDLRHGRPKRPDLPRVTNIMRVDPKTGDTSIAYGGRAGQELLSHIRGKHDPRPGGGFVITEFEAGRVLETNSKGEIIWEFVNAYDEQYVAELTGARVYPEDYFTTQSWQCE